MDGLAIATIVFCALSLAAAGVVKGIAGIGIPLVGISLLSMVISVPQAVALLPVPIIVANTYQALASGYFAATLRRFAGLLVCMGLGTVVGARMLTTVNQDLLMTLLGITVLAFATLELTRARIQVPVRHQGIVGAVCGLIGGVFGGMSALFGPPILMFVMSTGMTKDEFVGTITSIYLISGILLGVALAAHGVAGRAELLWSTLATAPLFLGLLAGQRARALVSEVLFRKGLLVFLVLAGLNLIRRGLLQ